MSELKLVSPLLDGFAMGYPISDRDGIRCCPALKETTDEKYIVKIISVPASQVQLDALLLTGAYKDPSDAMDYFKAVADSITAEVETLNTLAKLEGFVAYEGIQVVPMDEGNLGYDIYLLRPYKRSLQRYCRKKAITHLEAVNLGLDLCAALAICRRAGYLYVDLKPENIFLSKEKQFRIGDIGFVKLDSVSFASLPGKYRSAYSPREVLDDMKTLNTTVDTYAVGMILYQLYNEGLLPAVPPEPKDAFPHPANADYEISSIIMKALDPDPAKRWADPMEMGQALVGYMQRNTVNKTPIAPPSGFLVTDETISFTPISQEMLHDAESVCSTEAAEEVIPAKMSELTASEAEEASTELESPAEEMPEQPVQPAAPDSEESEDDEDFTIAFTAPAPEKPAQKPAAPQKPMPVRRQRKSLGKRILTACIVLLMLICIGSGCWWFYQTQYLQTIDALVLDGTQHELVVSVETDMDHSLLTVSCTDTYGNSIVQPLVNGQAVFTDLLPDSLYRIEVITTGFHELTGKTGEIFTTDAMPTVLSMSAVTGAEDGSAIVNITVDGTDADEWMITCTSPGEEDITETFTGHTVTVRGMTPGKMYTMTLGSPDGDQILGECTLDFNATRLILAENLTIADYVDGILTVRWDMPEDAAVEAWTVRCYNDEGHEEVLEIAGTEISFTGIDKTKAYTVEVTASGMTEPNRITVSANPLTVNAVETNISPDNQIGVSWTFDGTEPEDGWILLYTLDNGTDQSVVKCDGNTAVIDTWIPGASYHLEIQAADSTSVFNNYHSFVCPEAEAFSFEGLSSDKVTAHLLVTPQQEDWHLENTGEAFMDTFKPGESISVVLKAGDNFYLPETEIAVMYVIRDAEGNVLPKLISRETRIWKDIWYAGNYHNGELTIPEVPADPGQYTVDIYFNSKIMASSNFTVSE